MPGETVEPVKDSPKRLRDLAEAQFISIAIFSQIALKGRDVPWLAH